MDVTGEVFAVKGSKVTRWTDVTDGPSMIKDGDPRSLWSLDELDAAVSAYLIAQQG